jgi:hypothetical protein
MITDQMVEKGAKVLSPFAFERDEDGSYTYGEDARDEARRDVRKILTAALGDAVVVPREPKPEMCECGPLIGDLTGGRTPAITTSQAHEVYVAMLAAASTVTRHNHSTPEAS